MSPDEVIGRLLVDIALVIVLGRLLGLAFARFGQPAVLAEIFVGIALGPSLFGAIAPGASATLFPEEVTHALAAIGGVGLVLFMFFVGLELDLSTAREHKRTVSYVSAGSLILPFAMGTLLAVALYNAHSGSGEDAIAMAPFLLFVGTAMSVTAFPVLARILSDNGVASTRLATLATASAAVQDLIGWIMLAVTLAVLDGGGVSHVSRITLEAAAFLAVLFVAVKPLLQRILSRPSGGDSELERLALIAAGLLGCAGATQLIGLHSVIGAFLFGVVFPRDCQPRTMAALQGTMWPLTIAVLLPVYFISPGLNVDIGGIGASGFLELLAIVGVACAAKWGGTTVAARYTGLTWRDSGSLGVLLNTRGLIELVILNIGFTAGVLDQPLYSEFVLMALVTTLMTSPFLRASRRKAYSPMWQVTLNPLRASTERVGETVT